MAVLNLAGWEILDRAPGEGHHAELALGGNGWIPVSAPGDTYLALHIAGRIPHPLADEGEASCAWIRDREWWWRTSFDCEPAHADERLLLAFDGLDTYADIWLDGEWLGRTDNMFLPVRFDIGSRLRGSRSRVLLLRFTPPVLVDGAKPTSVWPIADPIKESRRNLHRKAQFGWGWDWGPSLPTVGIWRPVRVLRQRQAVIDEVSFSTLELMADAVSSARVAVTASLDCFALPADRSLSLRVRMSRPDGTCVAHDVLAVGAQARSLSTEFLIERPQLWWTPELGEPALHDLEVELFCGEDCIDRRTLQVGIRRIELDTSADDTEPGHDFFRFVLNGVSLFARGVNWIPASSLIGAVTTEDCESYLQAAADANMNMIRVWGGGVYEDDSFYDWCDRHGLLVWQDFMFASAPYPDHDEAFVDRVRQEVASQVRRLRHHACLALWCGNNECQCAHELLDYMRETKTRYEGERIFEETIPDVLRELDPVTPYWPGSPYGGAMHNSMRRGDVHNWTVWHGLPPIPDDRPVGEFIRTPTSILYTRYVEDHARFVSEFGIQAAPALDTLAEWVAPERLTLGSPAFLNRIKDHPKDKIDMMLLPATGLPANLAEYVEYTQLVQAEGLKFGIEHYRRRKPHCAGALIWQHNDCWPGISWSLIDHARRRKASWYYVRRAYATVMGSFKRLDSGDVELWVTHDGVDAVAIEAVVSLVHLRGDVLWTRPVSATVTGNASTMIGCIDARSIVATPAHALIVRSPQFPDNRLLFAPFKDLPPDLVEPDASIQALPDGGVRVVLKACGYHPLVSLQVSDAAARFSDNHFDLGPGERRTIDIHAPQGLRPADVRIHSFHPRTECSS